MPLEFGETPAASCCAAEAAARRRIAELIALAAPDARDVVCDSGPQKRRTTDDAIALVENRARDSSAAPVRTPREHIRQPKSAATSQRRGLTHTPVPQR
jgi:hypothetical protein